MQHTVTSISLKKGQSSLAFSDDGTRVLVSVEVCRYLPWPRSYFANSLFSAVGRALVFCFRRLCVLSSFLEVFDLLHKVINLTHRMLGRFLLLLGYKVEILRFFGQVFWLSVLRSLLRHVLSIIILNDFVAER